MADRIHDAFAAITASERLKASTKQYLRKTCEKRSKQRITPAVRRSVCTACAVVAVVLGIGIYHGVSQTPVSYISVDVNPSIELALNRWDTVISASSYNDDCAAILEGVSVKGMAYTEAVDVIVESEAMQPFLQDTAALTITVASDSMKRQEKIKTEIEHCAVYQNYGGRSCTSDVALIDEAHGNGMSFGKYAAYLLLTQYDAAITPDECRNMKMAEINKLIGQYEHSEKRDEPDTAGENVQIVPSHEEQQGEPASTDNAQPPSPIVTNGSSDGGPVAPDPQEMPPLVDHPGVDEKPAHPKDAPDANSGLDVPSPPEADIDHAKKDGLNKHDAPNENGQQGIPEDVRVPEEKREHRKGEKEPDSSDPAATETLPAATGRAVHENAQADKRK